MVFCLLKLTNSDNVYPIHRYVNISHIEGKKRLSFTEIKHTYRLLKAYTMKKLVLGSITLLTLLSSHAFASSSGISMANQNFETKICYVAATEGLAAAKALVSNKGLSFRKFEKSVTCNNKDIASFAQDFVSDQTQRNSQAKVELVATNNDIESKICLESLTHGIDKTAAKYKINKDYIRCNGKPLPRFVNENKRRGATVASVPE